MRNYIKLLILSAIKFYVNHKKSIMYVLIALGVTILIFPSLWYSYKVKTLNKEVKVLEMSNSLKDEKIMVLKGSLEISKHRLTEIDNKISLLNSKAKLTHSDIDKLDKHIKDIIDALN